MFAAEVDRKIFENPKFDTTKLDDPFFLTIYDLMQMRKKEDKNYKPISWQQLNSPKYHLNITGLMDWANIQNQETLSLLRNNIDEIVIQTFQGTKTIENYQAYLQRIETLKLPFKVDLVQNGAWSKMKFYNVSYFKGYVVFLLRSEH